MSEKVSIALATYNGEKFLFEQLNSFANQTRRPDELIISDDCSTDNTVKILYEFATSAPFEVKIYTNDQNIGYAQNFSKALELCTGDYVFLSDQDDVWFSNKISRMLDKFKDNNNIQLLIHDVSFCRNDLTEIGQTKIERMNGIYDVKKDYVVGMASAVRKNFLSLCLPIPNINNLSHDSWLHQCALAVDSKEVLYEVLAFYRRHSTNVTISNRLNVDFFTSSNYIKGGRSLIMYMCESLKNFFSYRLIDKPELQHLTRWLQLNKDIIIDSNYCSECHIKKLIKDDMLRVASIEKRLNIISMNRCKRIYPVIISYCNGNYRFFCGWKSAVKDLIIK